MERDGERERERERERESELTFLSGDKLDWSVRFWVRYFTNFSSYNTKQEVSNQLLSRWESNWSIAKWQTLNVKTYIVIIRMKKATRLIYKYTYNYAKACVRGERKRERERERERYIHQCKSVLSWCVFVCQWWWRGRRWGSYYKENQHHVLETPT